MEHLKRPFFGSLFQYLQEFTPKDWGEKRPFAFELDYKAYGLVLEPRDGNIREKLKKIEDVQLRRDGTCIVVSRNAKWIARNFYWFALRSLRDNEYRNLWALFHSILNSNDKSTSAEEVSSLSGYDFSLCKKWLDELVHTRILVRKGNKYAIEDSSKFLCLSDKYRKAAPTSTEELTMGLLCSNYGLYKGEVCDLMLELHGLGKSAVYKAIGNLKNKNFISVSSKHVEKRGPARDYLFVNCQNCFFLFASRKECIEYETTNLLKHLEKSFGRELENEEKAKLLKFMRSRTDAPQLLRKLNLMLHYFLALKEEIVKDKSLQEVILFLEKEMNLNLRFDRSKTQENSIKGF